MFKFSFFNRKDNNKKGLQKNFIILISMAMKYAYIEENLQYIKHSIVVKIKEANIQPKSNIVWPTNLIAIPDIPC